MPDARSERGFSLVEMLVAMTITLIVSGAIYGLLSTGQSAFRREPELTDRQQNARIALSLIMRDITNAGSGMPVFAQVFAQGLDACAACPNNHAGVKTDELQLLTNNGAVENEPTCLAPGNGIDVRLMRPAALPNDTVVTLFMNDNTWTLRSVNAATVDVTAFGTCIASATGHASLDLTTGDPGGLNTTGDACGSNGWGTTTASPCTVLAVSLSNVVRYRVRNDAAGVPVLQRWSSDLPSAFAGGVVNEAAYQTVARGIDDFQVEYATVAAPTTFAGPAPQVDPAGVNFGTLINQVRVTLGARSEARNLQGGQASNQGRVRGELMSVGTPRAILFNLANVPASPSPRPWL